MYIVDKLKHLAQFDQYSGPVFVYLGLCISGTKKNATLNDTVSGS